MLLYIEREIKIEDKYCVAVNYRRANIKKAKDIQ